MKKVLVTGADGFIGSHLTEYLVRQGCQVRAFVYYNAFNSWGWLDVLNNEIKEEIEIYAGDIRDTNGIRKAMSDIDTVYHLAALISIPYSYHSPDSYVETNVKGSLNVLEATKDLDIERVLITSTSEVYGTAQYTPIDENHPKQAQSPYAASKTGADALAESYYRSFGLPVSIVRPFNTYGPRQSARAIIPTVITQIAQGYKEIRVGDLSPTRDLNYVQDVVQGFHSIAKCDEAIGREINIASKYEISMKDTLNLIKDIMQSDVSFVTDKQRIRPSKSEVFRLLGDNSLITSLTKWKPQYKLTQGLQETIDWFMNSDNLNSYKANIYNI